MMKTKTDKHIRPVGDRVLVRRKEADERTVGGILLPEAAKEKPKEGVVLAVGEGEILESGERRKPSVQRGDRVLFTSYAGNEIQFQGEELILMREQDILAVLS